MTDADRVKQAREHVRSVREKLPWLLTKEGSREFYGAHMEAAEVNVLVDLARDGDREALDILRKRSRHWHREALNAGRAVMEVPTGLHELLLEMFIYGPPKAKRGSSPKDTGLRYQTIALLVKIVHGDFGFPEYTQPENRGDPDAPMTACRLVGEELGLSERRVEEIWAERKAAVMAPRRDLGSPG